MEKVNPIKSFSGRILGYIWTDTKTKIERVTNFSGRVLGFYNPKTNLTTTFSGKIIAEGNVLASLLVDSDKR